jgi:predicted enzyme related to lactoylglutathione lyase
MKNRVIGIGGIFFKSKDPVTTRTWYETHLGIKPDGEYGSTFEWRKADAPDKKGYTAWSAFAENTQYFLPSQSEMMVNYRVENLEALLEVLRTEGVEIVGNMEVYEYGKFAWILDPDGRKIELWQPFDVEYEKILGVTNPQN